MPPPEKCPKCGIDKALNEFSKMKDGLQGYCKPCMNDAAAKQRVSRNQFLDTLPDRHLSMKDRAILWAITNKHNMDDFLTKPIIPVELKSTLNRWLPLLASSN